jgi:membrane protein YdbS with pleckstrin-like domain
VLGAVADGVDRPLDPSSIAVRRIAGAITVGTVAGSTLIALLVRLLAAQPTKLEVGIWLFVWLAVSAALGVLAWVWPPVAFRHAYWRIDGSGMQIRRGVLWRSIVSIPRARVQHTDVRQGPVERTFGLATLVVHTAGTEHAAIVLAGVAYETALAIRDHLIDVQA